MWIFFRSKFSWCFCFIWEKRGKLKWLYQFFYDIVSFFNSEEYCYLYALWRRDFLLHKTFRRLLSILIFVPDWHLVSYFLFLFWSPSLSWHTVFGIISSKTLEVLSFNPSGNLFASGEFKVHHNDWLTYLGEIQRFGELIF